MTCTRQSKAYMCIPILVRVYSCAKYQEIPCNDHDGQQELYVLPHHIIDRPLQITE